LSAKIQISQSTQFWYLGCRLEGPARSNSLRLTPRMFGQGIKQHIKIPTRRKNVQKDLKNRKGVSFVLGPNVALAFDRWLAFFGHRLISGEIHHVVSLFMYRLLSSTNSTTAKDYVYQVPLRRRGYPRHGGSFWDLDRRTATDALVEGIINKDEPAGAVRYDPFLRAPDSLGLPSAGPNQSQPPDGGLAGQLLRHPARRQQAFQLGRKTIVNTHPSPAYPCRTGCRRCGSRLQGSLQLGKLRADEFSQTVEANTNNPGSGGTFLGSKGFIPESKADAGC
jgi:hypothetical protein